MCEVVDPSTCNSHEAHLPEGYMIIAPLLLNQYDCKHDLFNQNPLDRLITEML